MNTKILTTTIALAAVLGVTPATASADDAWVAGHYELTNVCVSPAYYETRWIPPRPMIVYGPYGAFTMIVPARCEQVYVPAVYAPEPVWVPAHRR